MKIGFIGSGWRTRTYWRIIRMLPERFEISGVYFRDAEKAAAYEAEGQPFGGKAYTDLDEFLAAGHDMVMILIPRKAVLPYIEKDNKSTLTFYQNHTKNPFVAKIYCNIHMTRIAFHQLFHYYE